MKNLMTDWQTVLFRNYGMAPDEALAGVLDTDAETVRVNARKLGLAPRPYNADWREKGFVTIYRNNWDILPEEDIRILLGVSEREYAARLEEYDFLNVKLGKKPQTTKPVYRPLTAEEEARTARVKAIAGKFPAPKVSPFDFYVNSPTAWYEPPAESGISDRFVSSYSARYSGALLDGELSDYPPRIFAEAGCYGHKRHLAAGNAAQSRRISFRSAILARLADAHRKPAQTHRALCAVRAERVSVSQRAALAAGILF